MSFENPTPMQRFSLGWFTHNFLGGFYRKYFNTLPIPGNARVLDFGSGSGMCSRFLLKKLDPKHGLLTCLEPSGYWLDYAKTRLGYASNVYFTKSRITDNTLHAAYFDVVNIHLVLHDIEKSERQPTIHALFKHLKNGGVVYIREPIGIHHGIPVDEIHKLFGKAGFDLMREEDERMAWVGKGYKAVFRKP